MHLFLVGCTGFVGRELVPLLLARGHDLTLISRRSDPLRGLASDRLKLLQLDPSCAASWQDPRLRDALGAAEGVVNLAGEPIADRRWTPSQLQLLRASRLETTRHLVETLKECSSAAAVLVQGSAVGIYGTSPTARFSESSASGTDFLSGLCRDWEAAAAPAAAFSRLVILRIGIVLGSDGGALGKMLPVFRAGFGGPVGSGRQWMSWIQRTDLCQLLANALEDPAYSGIYNAVAPQPVSMAVFASALGKALGRPSLLPVPGPLLQLLLGDGSQVVLEGQQVISERLEAQGFRFSSPDLASALAAATS